MTKIFKPNTTKVINVPKYIAATLFDNKRFDFIHLNSSLLNNIIAQYLIEASQEEKN